MPNPSNTFTIAELEGKARQIRRDILEMGLRAGGCHLAPALSCADLITALYFRIMHVTPQNPKDDTRDRFILSAGHKCAALYVALAQAGFIGREVLDTFSRHHSILGGHPGTKIPGVEIQTGSLGHGLPIGVGLSLGAKLSPQLSARLDRGGKFGPLPEPVALYGLDDYRGTQLVHDSTGMAGMGQRGGSGSVCFWGNLAGQQSLPLGNAALRPTFGMAQIVQGERIESRRISPCIRHCSSCARRS